MGGNFAREFLLAKLGPFLAFSGEQIPACDECDPLYD